MTQRKIIENDFAHRIMILGKKYMPRNMKNAITIDFTQGTNDYSFQLTTVMVFDENRPVLEN